MFCVNCGVRLGDTEKVCPLCGVTAYHPDVKRESVPPLYPTGRKPKPRANSKAFNGAVIIMFLIPIFVCLLSDLQSDGVLNWAGYAIGAILLVYITAALPLWFRKPNPVVFVPCNFAAIALYLLYIDLETSGGWFLPFALPLTGTLCLIACAVVTLLRCLRKGRLYIWGGAFMALGLFAVLTECLITAAFAAEFTGWSIYPLIVLLLFGMMLIYLAINRSAREMMERKLFF